MRRKIEVFILATLTFLFINGCSNKSTPVSVEPPATTLPETMDGTDYSYQSASNSNQNLWDTTTVNDIPAASPTPTPSPTPVAGSTSYPTQWNCLNGNAQYYPTSTSSSSSGSNPPWYGSGLPSTMSTSCFDSSWGGFFGDDMLFDAGIGAFGAMQGCYNTIMAKAPQVCAAGYDVNEVFQMSQMALVRCFRGILRKQMQMAYWAQPQVQTFQQTDASFYLLLQLFSQENGN